MSTPSDAVEPSPKNPSGRAAGGAERRIGPPVVDPVAVTAAQKDRYGGIKWGSAFFGWLTATGTAVLLIAVAAAAGAGVVLATRDPVTGQSAAQNADNAQSVGIGGALALLVILFLAYYCGGYVAGRMARFHGARQGFAVWLWALVIAILVAIVAAIARDRFDVLANLNALPRLPINQADLTTAGVIAAALALAAALLGAILGGMAGMLFHRRVDREVPAGSHLWGARGGRPETGGAAPTGDRA
jgi:hypothetical protein